MTSTIATTFFVFGLAIVISLIVAVLIKGVVMILPLFDRKPEPKLAPVVVDAPEAVLPGVIPPEHVAAIMGAVTEIVGIRHILHIEDRGRGAVWTAEGRMMHHTSHAISRRPKR